MRFCNTIFSNQLRNQYGVYVKTGMRTLQRQEAFDPGQHDSAAPGQDPAEQAARADELDHFVSNLPEQHRKLLLGIVDGELLAKVAKKLNIRVRTAQLNIERVRQKWLARLREQEEGA